MGLKGPVECRCLSATCASATGHATQGSIILGTATDPPLSSLASPTPTYRLAESPSEHIPNSGAPHAARRRQPEWVWSLTAPAEARAARAPHGRNVRRNDFHGQTAALALIGEASVVPCPSADSWQPTPVYMPSRYCLGLARHLIYPRTPEYGVPSNTTTQQGRPASRPSYGLQWLLPYECEAARLLGRALLRLWGAG